MGFRNNAYATVWGVEAISNTLTRGRISTSRKSKQTGEYEQDFGGFVTFVGSAAASKALSLKEKDRIKLGEVDVTNKYDRDKQTTFTNYNIFSFDIADSSGNFGVQSVPQPTVDTDEFDDSRLPF